MSDLLHDIEEWLRLSDDSRAEIPVTRVRLQRIAQYLKHLENDYVSVSNFQHALATSEARQEHYKRAYETMSDAFQELRLKQIEIRKAQFCVCHDGSVCGKACWLGKHHSGCSFGDKNV